MSGTAAPASEKPIKVSLDNATDPRLTVVKVEGPNRPGLLNSITAAFRDLGIDVARAVVDGTDANIDDTFYVRTPKGDKLPEADHENVRKSIELVISARSTSSALAKRRPRTSAIRQVGAEGETPQERKELLYNLMDTYQKNDVLSIQEQIVKNVEYTIGRSRWVPSECLDERERMQRNSL